MYCLLTSGFTQQSLANTSYFNSTAPLTPPLSWQRHPTSAFSPSTSYNFQGVPFQLNVQSIELSILHSTYRVDSESQTQMHYLRKNRIITLQIQIIIV